MRYHEYRSIRSHAGMSASVSDYVLFFVRINFLWPWLIPAQRLYAGAKGLIWCRRFHRPLLDSEYSYGGRDWTGRHRRGELRQKRCLVCGNTWVVREDKKPLTWQQCEVGHAIFGSSWVGPTTKDAFEEYTRKIRAAAGGEGDG